MKYLNKGLIFYYTGWAASCAQKNLKQIEGKLKLEINFDWNQSNMKVMVTDTFKKKKGCFIPHFLHCFHYISRKSLVRDLRPTLYIRILNKPKPMFKQLIKRYFNAINLIILQYNIQSTSFFKFYFTTHVMI